MKKSRNWGGYREDRPEGGHRASWTVGPATESIPAMSYYILPSKDAEGCVYERTGTTRANDMVLDLTPVS